MATREKIDVNEATKEDLTQIPGVEDATAPVPEAVYRYEIQIRYSSGDKITAEFTEKTAAWEFLNRYE
ncbi:MAG: helix-hairpin-helix domain-containing protein [Planctomycetes bacterium]|jgi:hypothetical protein|nr:helix-hairpin-helix domain-containing protein [Planctomycetota bacterium]